MIHDINESEDNKQISAASVVNYNGLIMNRVNIALSYIDHGYSGYTQVMGIRAILKPQFTKELATKLHEFDKHMGRAKYLESLSDRKGFPSSQKVKWSEEHDMILKKYTWDILTEIIACLDRHGILEFTERDLIDSGVVH